ncbi:glycoside hydrolase family 36 protein [Aeromonas sp. sif2433]|uniref:glycoside hydrolase family 36 protein n=1 Tax=Aeromonas sp. sif2433 TaxID=2854794 RepID=UPI001C487F1C|nr:glycoside hydrolase family 36 protein [Aeromonas sp. sif2433]MBV7413100.1 alpha-galactosidase [Aeromonas sp. sif2433]
MSYPALLSVLRQWPADPALPSHLLQTRQWDGPLCRVRLDNTGATPEPVQDWLLFDGELGIPPEAAIYGEGFQMLAQTMGTWQHPEPVGRCPDAGVYRITADQGYHTVHSLLLVERAQGWLLLAFASCQRFGGEFRLYPEGRLQILMNGEGRVLAPGQHWQSEALLCLEGPDREALLGELASRVEAEHGSLVAQVPARPSGWCSWYHYYAQVSAADIRENLAVRAERFPGLRYVQIDDGYQARMGDWLTPSPKFEQGVAPLAAEIRAAGCEPALWVAPFIAEPGSRVFQDHPDWFVKGDDGLPLPSERVTYGGWRCTPWYVLDGTHPEVQAHLERVFRTLREQWGIHYFKLDANFWGAIHGGHFCDPSATRVEAYRRGMAAVLRGAGEGAFLLGCNAPLWPSLGLVHGMRVSDDVERQGPRFRQIAREAFCRAWQNDRLWALDPDCVCLRDLPNQQAGAFDYQFHLAALVASGGMVLAGDRLQDLDELQGAQLLRLLALCEARAPAARFDDMGFSRGRVTLPSGGQLLCLFNWDEQAKRLALPAGGTDFWDDSPLGDALVLQGGQGRVIRYA